MFCAHQTFFASNSRRMKKPRRNCRFGLENLGPGRPGEPRASKFERQNGQVEQPNATKAREVQRFFFKWVRTGQSEQEKCASKAQLGR